MLCPIRSGQSQRTAHLLQMARKALGEFQRLIEYLPSAKARVDEDLFKLRMNAKPQVGDLERIHTEVANAPLIPTLWRMVVEASTFAMQEKYTDSKDVLDRLIPLLGDDPREVRGVCLYLEASKDIEDSVMFWRNSMEQSIHARFALNKLRNSAGSADIIEAQKWLGKLSELAPRIHTSLLLPLSRLRLEGNGQILAERGPFLPLRFTV